MSMVINTNTASLVAQAAQANTNKAMDTAMERLSTGKRINTAADDAAGMAISTRMESQIRGIQMAMKNAGDGQSLIDTTEGAHDEITNILQRMRELSVQAVNDTNVTADRVSLQSEVTQLIAEIDRIANQTTWNGVAVLDGTFTSKTMQIGAEANQTLSFGVDSVKSADLGSYKTELASQAYNTSGTDLAADTLAVTGHLGTASVTVATTDVSAVTGTSATTGETALNIAAGVNAVTSSTGVSATAKTQVELSALAAAGAINFSINGTSIGSTTVDVATDLRGIRDAINAISGTTGITAAMGSNNSKVVLTSATGNNIDITSYSSNDALTFKNLNSSGSAVSTLTLDADAQASATVGDNASARGYVILKNEEAFNVDATTGSPYADATASMSGNNVSSIDIGTASGAASAIDVIDAALSKINSARGDLGAISNRLDSTISNLTNIKVNIETSQSRIQDADFAAETSNLTKSQILSQAATAMLAQANASKQSVLSLLQG